MRRITGMVAMLIATVAWAQFTPEQLQAMRERASRPAPNIGFDEFLGMHEADVPERVGIPNPAVKMVLECSGTSCMLAVGAMREHYPNPGTVRLGLFERTQKSVARRFAGAQLRGCMNLAGDAMPDGKQSVLLVPPGEEVLLYPQAGR
jgi:hypothetical protein